MKKKQSKNLIDNLAVSSPCSISWDSMVGNDRERNCSGCNKIVYNISDMTKTEAERFLRDNSTAECVKFRRRFDGTIVTDDCPRALQVVRDRCKMAAKVVFGMFAFCISLPAAFTQSLHNQSPMLQSPEFYASQVRTAGTDFASRSGPFQDNGFTLALLGKIRCNFSTLSVNVEV